MLTAENLRQELISLWRGPNGDLSSVFMVTHNIEEAVEMATRIVVVFPRPGRVGLVLGHVEQDLTGRQAELLIRGIRGRREFLGALHECRDLGLAD